MQSTITLPVTTCHVADPITITVTVRNTTDTPQVLHAFHEIIVSTDAGWLNDRAFNPTDWPDETTTLGPNEELSCSRSTNLPFLLTKAASGPSKHTILIRHRFYWLSDDPDHANIGIGWQDATLTLDNAGIDWVPTDYGALSFFCTFKGEMFAGGSFDMNTPLPKADPNVLQALTFSMLVSKGKLYSSGYSSARAPKAPLLGLNGVFFHSGKEIRTNYGPGKIDDPASFEVLEPCLPSLYSKGITEDGYQCSYARDKDCAYFFDESKSTKHAIKVRACKSPETLQSLAGAFAKDDTRVFLEGRHIKGTDAAFGTSAR